MQIKYKKKFGEKFKKEMGLHLFFGNDWKYIYIEHIS